MSAFVDWMAYWLADFYLAAMVLLAGGIETAQHTSAAAQEAMGALAESAGEALARILASAT